MLQIYNCGLKLFKENIKGKKLFMWGGGSNAELCYKEWGIKENIVAIVDSNEEMWNKSWHIDNRIFCINKERMVSDCYAYGINNCVLLITPVF